MTLEEEFLEERNGVEIFALGGMEDGEIDGQKGGKGVNPLSIILSLTGGWIR